MTTITALPTPPQTSDPTDFDARADAFLAALPTFVSQTNTVAGEVNTNALAAAASATAAAGSATAASASATAAVGATGYVATSTNSLSMAAASNSITIQAGKSFLAGDLIACIHRADPSIRLIGTVSSYSGTTLAFTVPSNGVVGSGGPFTDWLIISSAFSASGAVASELLALASAYVAVTPKAISDALAPYALTDAATVTPDGNLGWDFTWTIGGSRTLGNMTNAKVGQRGTITITQDGTGSRVLAVGSAWKRQGGLGVLSTSAAAVDYLQYEVKTISGTTASKIVYSLTRAPS